MPGMLRCCALLLCIGLLRAETILCLGDSLTAGYGLEESQAWPALLEARLAEARTPSRVVNAGVSGDTTTGGLQRLKFALRTKPDLVIIALGGNDGLRGQEIPVIEANLRTLVERVRAAKAIPILAGMQLPTNYGADYRQRFADLYPRIAKDLDVPLIPFLLDGVGGVAELNQPDGIHPNADGQRKVAETVHRALQALAATAQAKTALTP